MESIILVVISLIVSAFFKKGKDGKQQTTKRVQEVKPFTEKPFNGLEDLAKAFFEEKKEGMDRKPPVVKKAPVVTQKVERKSERTVERHSKEIVERDIKRDQGVPRSSGRLSVYQAEKPRQAVEPVLNSILPDTKEELMRAIVLSEILALPKSKR